jgi:hypothetical protein
MKEVIYSVYYNGAILYIFLGTGLFTIFCLSGLTRMLGWHRMLIMGVISSILIINAIIKMIFSKFVYFVTGWPWWVSLVIDIILVMFVAGVVITIWRVLRRCR